MQQIVECFDLLEKDKTRLYQQALQHYMQLLDQYKSRPVGLVDIKPEPVHKEQVLEKIPTLLQSKSQEESG